MALEFVQSERGHPKLVDGVYTFQKDKTVQTRTYWRCQFFIKYRCPARLTTVQDKIESRWKVHNHIETKAKVEAIKIRNEIKKRTRDTLEEPKVILATCLENASSSAIVSLPRISHLKRNMQRQRSKSQNYPKLPRSREDLILPFELTQTKKCENFILFDSGVGDADRIIIFGTPTNLNRLGTCDHWFVDGTFKTVPHLFYQLYSIHGLQGNKTFPLIYALLPNKSQSVYDRMLCALKRLDATLNPRLITMDFEMAAINSFQKGFPQAHIHGCFFHFCQALMREICCNGLKKMYEEDNDFSIKMRMLAALAFVPPQDVITSFETMIDCDIFPPAAAVVLDYFEDTWIGRPQRRKRRAPRYPLVLWNCYNRTINGEARTNNACEGWHRGFETLISGCHVNIFKLIQGLLKEQTLSEAEWDRNEAGERAAKRKKYIQCDDRLLNLVKRYPEVDCVDYLRGIAYNIYY